MSTTWEPVPLGEVVRQVTRTETTNPTKTYRLLGVRLDGGGPFLREEKTGAQVSAKQLSRVAEGDFIYSRLFAWRGAFGVIDSSLDGCYVSNEFPTFQLDPERLDRKFLRYWFRLPPTLAQVEEDCSGSTPLTRNRYKESFFLRLAIPLPPMEEQRRIVARVEELAAKVEEARGLQRSIAAEYDVLLRGTFARLVQDAHHRPMGEIAPLVRRPVEVTPSQFYHEVGIRSFGRGTFHKPAVSGASLGTKKLFEIQPGDLLFNIVFAWEGAVAIARTEDEGRVGSHRFLTCVPKVGVVTARFLKFYFLTKHGLKQLGDASPGGAGRNRTLGLKALERIEVPVPPIEKQLRFDALQMHVDRFLEMQAASAAELDALLPSILDKAFRGEL